METDNESGYDNKSLNSTTLTAIKLVVWTKIKSGIFPTQLTGDITLVKNEPVSLGGEETGFPPVRGRTQRAVFRVRAQGNHG